MSAIEAPDPAWLSKIPWTKVKNQLLKQDLPGIYIRKELEGPGWGSVLEHWCCMCEALSVIPGTTKQNKITLSEAEDESMREERFASETFDDRYLWRGSE